MKAHKNARTTPHNRALIVQRVLREGRTATSVAADFGVSERTVCKWLARYRAEGVLGLDNRSSSAHVVADRSPEPWIALIARLRRRCRITAREIAVRLPPADVSGQADHSCNVAQTPAVTTDEKPARPGH